MRDDYVGTPMMVAAFGGVVMFAVAMGMAVTSIAHHHPAPPPPTKHAHTASHPITTPPPTTPPLTAVSAVDALSADANTVAQLVRTPTPNIAALRTTCSQVKNLVIPTLPAGTPAAATTRLSDIVLDDVALQRTCGATILDVAASHGPSPVATADAQHVQHAIAALRADMALFSTAIGQS
ncbi:MAG TPA: hypothetical protein VNG12_06030 [Acidimicrobiales bacterium]|nr:hypothetical protein [Acidimicrobiales bacterium]